MWGARSARGPRGTRTARLQRLQPPQCRRCEYSSLFPRLATPASVSEDAAEADMAGRGVDRLGMARRGPVAPAIVGRAEGRATPHHPPPDAHRRMARGVA